MKKFSVFLALFILMFSMNWVIFESGNGREGEEHTLIQNMLYYFVGGTLSTEHYSEREVIHLHDVKVLVQLALLLMIIFLGASISSAYNESRITIQKGLIKGGILCLVLTCILALTLLNFSASFTAFHELVFMNDYWLLPADSTLLQLFPESFFVTATEQIILYSGTFSILCIAWGLRIPGNKKWQNTKLPSIQHRRARTA